MQQECSRQDVGKSAQVPYLWIRPYSITPGAQLRKAASSYAASNMSYCSFPPWHPKFGLTTVVEGQCTGQSKKNLLVSERYSRRNMPEVHNAAAKPDSMLTIYILHARSCARASLRSWTGTCTKSWHQDWTSSGCYATARSGRSPHSTLRADSATTADPSSGPRVQCGAREASEAPYGSPHTRMLIA